MLKKLSFIFVFLFGLAIIFYACDSPPILAQTDQPVAAQQSFIEDVGSLIVNSFATIPGLAALILTITAYVKKKNQYTGQFVIFVSLIVSLLLSALGYLLNIGIFVNVGWYYIFIYGLAACLIANGLADWNLVKSILQFLRLQTGTVAVFLLFMILTAASINNIDVLINKVIAKKNISSHLFVMNMTFRI